MAVAGSRTEAIVWLCCNANYTVGGHTTFLRYQVCMHYCCNVGYTVGWSSHCRVVVGWSFHAVADVQLYALLGQRLVLTSVPQSGPGVAAVKLLGLSSTRSWSDRQTAAVRDV